MVRLEIQKFAQAMEQTMRMHDPIKGSTWKDMSFEQLMILLNKEYKEVIGVEGSHPEITDNDLCKELVDLANISMMIWNKLFTPPSDPHRY